MLPFATAYHRRLTWRYFALFIAIGMTGGLLGPALPHLADSVGASMSQIAILFTARAVGNMSGAFVTGLLLDRFDGHKVLFAMGAIMVAGLTMTPFSPLLILLAGLYAPASFMQHFIVFVLAVFVGFQVIWGVAHSLHTPLMAVTNAISSIIILGALMQIGSGSGLVIVLAAVSVFMAGINIFGGFLVTRRMLAMFQKS